MGISRRNVIGLPALSASAVLLAESAAGADLGVLAGLGTTNKVVYYADRAEFDNWWAWEIGDSHALADCLVLLDGQIPAAARDRYVASIRHFLPDPWYPYIDVRRKLSTGANRVDLCTAAPVGGVAS